MNKFVVKYLLLFAVCLPCVCFAQPLLHEVNPLIGTGFHGHTYPGATVPFGAVQLSPDTRRGNWDACAGYHYSDSLILGFSHTHLSGTGCIDFGDILFYPMNFSLEANDPMWMKPLVFSHEDETCEPGYYAVKFRKEKIGVELTATSHTGMHRYHFEGNEPALVIDLAHTLDNEYIYEAEIHQTGPNELVGMRCTRGWTDKQYVYFVARFSSPLKSFTVTPAPVSYPQGVQVSGNKIQGLATFSLASANELVVQVGLSLVSIENARKNLEYDFNDFNFEATRKDAAKTWQQALSDIIIEGGTPDERINFYTSLYHCKIVPNVVSDRNGQYRRHNASIARKEDGRKQYSTFSLWDTFRAWHPLMTLLDTAMTSDMITSMLDIYDATGELPIWPLSSGETGTMIGYHSVSVIADAWLKGIRGFDGKKALAAMVASAEKNSKGAADYINQGYIPTDNRKESVSCLLEFAYDDWTIARMAESLGEHDIARRFTERSQAYATVFDGATRFFRGKRSDGNWESPFDPYQPGRSYTEATAWQYRFYVPHDVNGMIQLYGGQKIFSDMLDELFTTSSEIKGAMSDITGLIGQYAHGNEPSHHIAYLYSYAGQPWKTQELTRYILDEMYRPTPEGICGNEDCGQMSAWYVLSSLGFYPVCPGSGEFVLTTPLFPKAKLKLGNGRLLTITANRPEKNRYIRTVSLNGCKINRNYLTYEELMTGGELVFELSANPDRQRGIEIESFPYSYSREKQVSIPYTEQDLHLFTEPMWVTLGITTADAEIRYTLNGDEPDEESPLYSEPLLIEKALQLKAKGFKEGYLAGKMLTINATPAEYRIGESVANLRAGVEYAYYEGVFKQTEEMEIISPKNRGEMPEPSIAAADREDHFGYRWSGWIYVSQPGVYEFQTTSDDGSVLFIGNRKVVNNDGSHGAVSATGRIALDKGYHSYLLFYFEDYEGELFEITWKKTGSKVFEKIPPTNWFIKEK